MPQLGDVVFYVPTLTEFPMAYEQPFAAVITKWNYDTSKASLVVFPAGANYVMAKLEAEEGTEPGTFSTTPPTPPATHKGAEPPATHLAQSHSAKK